MAIQDCWRDVDLGLSPYNVHSHKGFLKHLMLRTGRYCGFLNDETMPTFY